MLQIFLYLQFTHKETNSERLNSSSKVIQVAGIRGVEEVLINFGDLLPKPVYFSLPYATSFPPGNTPMVQRKSG